jgi:hypothetical protein
MYLDKKDIFFALAKLVALSDKGTSRDLETILIHDGDVDQFDTQTRNKMAKTIDGMLEVLPSSVSELQDWSRALKGEDSGEIDELSRRAGI